MPKIDAHQHFWQFNPVRDSWITDELSVIRRDFLPEHLLPILQQNGIDACVAIQADQSEEETNFLLSLADKYDFIKGVVGWVDLQSPKIEERLEYYSSFEKLKGFRHILQGETNRSLALEPAFKRGIGLLGKYGFGYDILIFPDQLKSSTQLAKAFPDQKFVLDHIGKPNIKEGKIDEWAADIKQLSACENVWCKLSGVVTEADWKNWYNNTFIPYLDVIFNAFGTKRLMFGSDWPVCLVAADYGQVKGIIETYIKEFSATEQQDLFGGSAIEFYNL